MYAIINDHLNNQSAYVHTEVCNRK